MKTKKMNEKKVKKRNRNVFLLIGFLLISFTLGLVLYHANKPIFQYNVVEDTFEDQILGIFPIGWLSAVHPLDVKVISDHGNKVMQIKDDDDNGVTEVVRRFKKATEGSIECKVKPLDVDSGFVIHIPQRDMEYDPYDDIIIVFLKGGIYVIGANNIIEIGEDDSFWSFLNINKDQVWLIDEWKLPNYDPVMEYEANIWYSIKIDFNRDHFFLTINENLLGTFNYPKYNPPYFASLYFWSLIKPVNFKFYVDNVKITLLRTVDYIHPLNLILLLMIPITVIGFYILYKKGKNRIKKDIKRG